MLEKEIEKKDKYGKPYQPPQLEKVKADFYAKKLFFKMKTEMIEGVKTHCVQIIDDTIPNEAKEISIPVENMFDYFTEKGDLRLYNYFQALIRLSASICLARSYKSILFLQDIYELDQVIDCVLNKRIPSEMRANFAKLLIHLHLDKDPLEKLVIPVMTRVWDDIEAGTMDIPCSKENIPENLLALKPALNEYILSFNGVLKVYETEENIFILEALRVIETMIELGFYTSAEELIGVTSPLIHVLNGISDYYSPEEKQ